MASTFKTSYEIHKFDGNYFALWKEMMQDVLTIRCQIEAIQHNNKLTEMSAIEWRSLDEIVRSTIRIHLAENVYFSMVKETVTFALWEKLQTVYEKKSSSAKFILIRQVFNMKMKETEPVTSHINIFNWVLAELSSQGLNFDEEIKALALLPSLPTSWDVFCTTITNGSSKLTLDEAIMMILAEDIQ